MPVTPSQVEVTQQPSKKLYDDRIFTRKMSEKLFDENPDRNFVWSPISLEMALAAVMMGAKGNTFDQLLERVFHAPDRHYYLTDLVSSLKKTSTMYKSEEATLTYATILALDNFFRVKEHYMKKL
uniref:Serpin domain-containing protein n=1 Tax=Romanomermis culicivorax TaxID=13658 RepID=A0A915IE31_ROMCU